MAYRIIQWCVTVKDQPMAMFTQTHDREQAVAIALATFGSEVSAVVDEGSVKQEINNYHYNRLVDSMCCEHCGEMDGLHEMGCKAEAGAA